jgi:hypothetical protein
MVASAKAARTAAGSDAELRAGEPEEGPVAVLAADIGNLRAAAEFGLATGDTEVVRRYQGSLRLLRHHAAGNKIDTVTPVVLFVRTDRVCSWVLTARGDREA